VDDVYATLREARERECLFVCADDRESPPAVNDRYRKLRNAGIRFRQLVREGNSYLMGPPSEYRWVPKERFRNNVTLIYADKVAVTAGERSRAVIFKDAELAASWRNLVELLWQHLEQPERSTADERF